MRYIIAGAGKLGRLLAGVLSAEHDTVLIDTSTEKLEQIRSRYDISPIKGSCCDVELLKRADVAGADAFLAVTGDEATNILACQIASRLGSEKNVCRLYNHACLSDESKIFASSFHLDYVFSPPDEVSEKLMAIIRRPVIQDEFRYPHSNAKIAVVVIPNNSPVQNVCIKDIPDRAMLNNIRIAAIVKNRQLSTKVRGDIMLNPGDRLYVCGTNEHVEEFIDYISPDDERKVRRLLLAGSDEFCVASARKACKRGYEVSIICKDTATAENIEDELGRLAPHVLFYYGNPTDEYLLKEAGAESADVFINMQQDDEDNILSCIVAKGLGAAKVISVTHRPEYSRIFREIKMIDCSFCVTAISGQTVIGHLGIDISHLDEILHDVKATVAEFAVISSSPLCGKTIIEANLRDNVTFALIFRNGETIAPIGSTVLLEGDRVLVIGTSELFHEVAKLFPKD